MSRFEMRLLGTPEVRIEGQLLTFPTRKTLALLVYLAVTGERQNREKLIALFWPESGAAQGQASLRNTLLRLRRALEQGVSRLNIEAVGLAFETEPGDDLDWRVIAAAAKTTTVPTLQEAANLYRGDFLEGFTLPDAPAFDEWVTTQREHWHSQMTELLSRLSRLQMDAGDITAGLVTARRWMAHDPLNEAAHRCLLELHLMNGDHAAALQTYERCRSLLWDELGLEPAPATQALAERARTSGNKEARRQRDRVREDPLTLAAPPLLMPFVGRSVKHLQLVTAFHTVQKNGAQVIVIRGEAGIGKTRLAAEFLRWASVRGADALSGRALAAGGRFSYQPLIEALRPRLEQENAPEDLLGDVWLAELSRLLPELHERYPDLTPLAADEAVARTRLLEAVARLGEALAHRRQPVILCLDDLQWADTATLDVLHYCGRAWAQNHTPILLLFTLREEELSANRELAIWLSGLDRDLPVQYLFLNSLMAEDTDHLIQTLTGPGSPESINKAFSDWLFHETAGQPFFITETLKELTAQGVVRWQVTATGAWSLDISRLPVEPQRLPSLLPQGVQRLIQTRLGRLSPEGLSLLRAAAVLGREASYSHLCQVAGLDEAEGLSGLDELSQGRLLLESGPMARPYAVAHDKIRELVYAESGAARLHLLHRRAFTALEATAPPAELAHHALAAQLAEPAFRYSVLAGEAALALFAVRDALVHFEQAQALRVPGIRDEAVLRPRLYLGLGRAYELAGELAKAEAVYLTLREMAQQLENPDLECTALNRLATDAVHRYQFDAAAAYLQEAVQVAEASGRTSLLAATEWSQAQLTHHLFDFQASWVHSERVLALAHELDDQELIAGSLNSLAYAQMLCGEVTGGLRQMEEAHERFVRLGNQALQADCLTAIAAAHIWLGEAQAGIAAARAAEAICAAIDNPWGHIYSRVWLATGLLEQGEYAAALAVAQAGQQLAEKHQLPPMRIFINLVAGKVYQALQQPEQALEAHAAAAHLNREVQSEAFTELIAAELCTDYVLAGQWDEALHYARQALSVRRYASLPLVVPARWPETAALCWGGEITLAREDVRRWGAKLGHVPRFRLAHLRSLAALNAEDSAQTIRYLEEALALAETIHLPGEQQALRAQLRSLAPLPPDPQAVAARR